jgi:hypothetical protein
MGKSVTGQSAFVKVFDDGNESGSTLGTPNADWTENVDTVFRARFAVSETAGGTEAQGFQLMYNHNGGGYNLVTNTTPIQYTVSAEDGWTITDQDATTNRLAGSGSFVAGEYSEDAVVTTPITIDTQYTNLEFCLTIDSAQVSDEDTILLQVYFDGGEVMDFYTNTPTITVNIPAAERRIFVTHV